MANIKQDSFQKYVKDLILKGFNTKDNKEKSFRHEQKSTIDEHGSDHRQSKSKCPPKVQ